MNTFQLSVNYEMKLERAIIFGQYDWINPNLISKGFQTNQKGRAIVLAELIHFNRAIDQKEVIEEINKEYRPADIRELLAFGERYPRMQKKFPIVSLGSLLKDQNDFFHVPYLHGYGSERYLGIHCVTDTWREMYRFLVIKNG